MKRERKQDLFQLHLPLVDIDVQKQELKDG